MCVYTLGVCDVGVWEAQDMKQEIFDMINSKPEAAKTNDYVNNLYKQHKDKFRTAGRQPIKLALISDLHLDYDYLEGAEADCGKPLCCRSDSGMAKDPSRAAGKWGDFRCDLNKPTFDTMMEFIQTEI